MRFVYFGFVFLYSGGVRRYVVEHILLSTVTNDNVIQRACF